jgi:hypothetical protein
MEIENMIELILSNSNAENDKPTWVDLALLNIIEELLERVKSLEEEKEKLSRRINSLESYVN